MSEHRKSAIIEVLKAWRHPRPLDALAVEEDFRHNMSPEARMDLLLRFETESGPRTIVASGVSLSVASDITQAMIEAGHFADFRDQLVALPMVEHVRRRKAAKALPPKHPVVDLKQMGS